MLWLILAEATPWILVALVLWAMRNEGEERPWWERQEELREVSG